MKNPFYRAQNPFRTGDNQQRFKKTNEDKWLRYSDVAREDIREDIAWRESFLKIWKKAAERRQEIAQALQHGSDESRKRYGLAREPLLVEVNEAKSVEFTTDFLSSEPFVIEGTPYATWEKQNTAFDKGLSELRQKWNEAIKRKGFCHQNHEKEEQDFFIPVRKNIDED